MNTQLIKVNIYELIWVAYTFIDLDLYVLGFAIPDHILFLPGLPKTRSGKIMRRILRKIAANKPDELGDISTLAEPEIVQTILDKHQHQNRR